MNRQKQCGNLAGLFALLLVVAGDLPAADPGKDEEILALPKVSVTANVPLVKVAEYHMHEKRGGAAAVLIGWYIYIIGGQGTHGKFVRTIERFDVQTGESKVFSALTTGRLWPQAVAVGDRIYVFGGASSFRNQRPAGHPGDAPRKGVEQSAEAQLANVATDLAPEALGEMYPEKSIEVLDTKTGAVTIVGDMPDPREEFGCVYLNGSIYVVGGKHLARQKRLETVTNRVDVFHPDTGAWTPGVNLPATSTGDAGILDGRIIHAGGYNGTEAIDSVLVFDPKTSAWSNLPPLDRPTSAHSTAFLGKYMFLFGDYDHPDEILAYNLRDKTSAVFTLQYETARHAPAVANAKRIFVIGGFPYRYADGLDTIQVFQLPPQEGAATGK